MEYLSIILPSDFIKNPTYSFTIDRFTVDRDKWDNKEIPLDFLCDKSVLASLSYINLFKDGVDWLIRETLFQPNKVLIYGFYKDDHDMFAKKFMQNYTYESFFKSGNQSSLDLINFIENSEYGVYIEVRKENA